MLEFQKKKKIRRIIYSPLTLILLVVIFFVALKGAWNVHQKAVVSTANLEREKTELAKLEARRENLASSIDYLKTEQGVEHEIRTKFRVAREGEMVAIIVDATSTASTMSGAAPRRSLLYRLFRWPQ